MIKMNDSNICPLCTNIVVYRHSHNDGKYNIRYIRRPNDDCFVKTTEVYLVNSWSRCLLLDGFVYLSKHRIEQFLLLQ